MLIISSSSFVTHRAVWARSYLRMLLDHHCSSLLSAVLSLHMESHHFIFCPKLFQSWASDSLCTQSP